MSWFEQVQQAVFPRFCVSCGQEGSLLCQVCGLTWQHTPPEKLGDHLALFAYANPTVRHLITTWKYTYDLSAFKILTAHAEVYLPKVENLLRLQSIDALVPLPLSSRRLRERGFNPSEQLAEWLSSKFFLPISAVLKRQHVRGHQADRSIEDRVKAMKTNPFHLIKPTNLPGRLLLIDDVYTTGATLAAAKKALEVSGKTLVSTFTLAQG